LRCDVENLKVKVKNEAESKEAQGYFEELGAVCCSGLERSKNVNFLFMNSGFVTACKLQENFDKSKCKEITIPELKELVVSHGNSKLLINGAELEGCTVENFSINIGGSMKNKIEQAKSILSLNNKELSELLGHHERYIDRVLREGVSLVQEKLIVKDIDVLLKMHDLEQQLEKEQLAACRLSDELLQLKSVVDGDDVALKNMATALGIAERDKRYMKRKLHDKSLVINWLLALNVFFVLFLVGKCVGLV